jgi:Tol biopolymer transport system component
MSRSFLFILALSALLAGCVAVDQPLPASVYYLKGSAEEVQVWRLETDGITASQVTHEAEGVDDFAVSPADGSLAFVSANQLFLQSPGGRERIRIADGTRVTEVAEDLVIRNAVAAPTVSPDGRTLAYALDGLHLYDIATGEDRHMLVNGGNLLGEPYMLSRENYAPGDWSPDGSRLVLSIGYADGATLAVVEPNAGQPFTRMRSTNPIAGGVSWSSDSRSLYVANPNFGVEWPGLWRYDVVSGHEDPLVTTKPGSSQFVGWPVEIPSGRLAFFYGDQFSPEKGIPLRMVKSEADGSNLVQVRDEEFSIGDALWSQDGSLALISQFKDGGHAQLLLARPDGSPLGILTEGEWIRQLAWGP